MTRPAARTQGGRPGGRLSPGEEQANNCRTPCSGADLSPSAFAVRPSLLPDAPLVGNLSTDVALSATDIWAFGSRTTAAVPLAEHYNGTTWKKTDLPTPQGSASTTIVGALAVSAGDIWLAGDWKNAVGDYQTLSEHWNGTTWSIVATPDPASWANNYLYSMSAVSPTDIWAVGTSLSADDMTNATLVEHWNGSAWSVVKSPDPSKTYSAFQAVYATSDSSVLAVGSTENASSDVVALSERWNGTAWVRQSTPLPSGDSADTFGGLDPVSPTDVWTYAWQENSATEIVPLAERWNGTKWTVVPTPVPSGAEGTLLAGMSASSATDAWLVGGDLLSNGTGGIVLMHWNGTAWSLVNAPARPAPRTASSPASRRPPPPTPGPSARPTHTAAPSPSTNTGTARPGPSPRASNPGPSPPAPAIRCLSGPLR